ncbi:hypothetical protein ESZ53_04565 [Salinibacterium sp. UTAS2018]|nr:hypothetical protein ESZ53_04565 [Salinibacterium sp. UTAS2018]
MGGAVVALTLSLTGCMFWPKPTVAIFEVGGVQRFTVELATPELVAHAQGLLAGDNLEAVPSGDIVPGDARVNAPWSWHIDPSTLEFSNVSTAECDGTPQDVEDGRITTERFCPWSARIVAIEGPDA